MSQAEQMYRSFHWGVAPKRRLRVEGPLGVPPEVAQLGRVVAIELANGQRLVPKGTVHLASDAGGRGLYLVAPRPVRFGAEGGPITAIEYQTRKGLEPAVVYRHVFWRPRPTLGVGSDGWPVISRGRSKFRVTRRGIER